MSSENNEAVYPITDYINWYTLQSCNGRTLKTSTVTESLHVATVYMYSQIG